MLALGLHLNMQHDTPYGDYVSSMQFLCIDLIVSASIGACVWVRMNAFRLQRNEPRNGEYKENVEVATTANVQNEKTSQQKRPQKRQAQNNLLARNTKCWEDDSNEKNVAKNISKIIWKKGCCYI